MSRRANNAEPGRRVECIFFDVGGTLSCGDIGHVDLLHLALRAVGYDVTRDKVQEANARARRAVTRRRRRTVPIDAREASRMWLDHVAGELDLDLRGEALENELARATRRVEASVQEYIDPEADEVLRELRRRGYRLGVISNWTRDLPEYLEAVGLARHFQTIVASEAVGVQKPHREIFLRALAGMKCAPRASVHVGDDYWADVVGAREIGIRPVLIDRRGDRPFDDCTVITRLRQLLEQV